MYRGSWSRVFPFVIVLVVVAIVVTILISIGRVIFGGASTSTTSAPSGQNLLNTSLNRSVRMTIRGPIGAIEDVRTSQIEISPESRRVALYSGYGVNLLSSENYGNTKKSYEELVYALSRARLSEGRQLDSTDDDTRGICPTGRLYEFDVLSSGASAQHLWTTSCSGANGSLRADVSAIKGLFFDQIPSDSKVIDDANL